MKHMARRRLGVREIRVPSPLAPFEDLMATFRSVSVARLLSLGLAGLAVTAAASCGNTTGPRVSRGRTTAEPTGTTSSALSTCVKQLEAVAPWPPAAWMVLRTDGTVWMNPRDQNLQWAQLPVKQVASLGNNVESLMDGDAETATYCVVKTDHSLFCWGRNSDGNIGDGTTNDRTGPVAVSGPGNVLATSTRSVTAGDGVTCAVTTGNDLYCWGLNDQGQVGTGVVAGGVACQPGSGREPHDCVISPTKILGPGNVLDHKVARASAGFDHTCALTTEGELYCWGTNQYGQTGDVATMGQAGVATTTPTKIAGLTTGTERVIAFTAGGFFTCAVIGATATATQGEVACWGQNSVGEPPEGMLGIDVNEDNRANPVRIPWLGTDNVAVDTGVRSGCAIKAGGGLRCWGWNDVGQLGDGTTENRPGGATPTGLTSGVTQVAVGKHTTCAVQNTSAFCWGVSITPDGHGPTRTDAGGVFPFAPNGTPTVVDFCSLAPVGGPPPCDTDAECSGATPVCHEIKKVCVQCAQFKTALCTGVTPTCDVESGQCSINCDQDEHCGAENTGRVCDSTTRLCRDGCRHGGGCATGQRCTSTSATIGDCEAIPPDNEGDTDGETTSGAKPGGGEIEGGGCSAVASTKGGARSFPAIVLVLGVLAVAGRARRRRGGHTGEA